MQQEAPEACSLEVRSENFGTAGVSQPMAMSRNKSSKVKMMTTEEWREKLEAVHIRKEDMNKLIMDFFLTQGYVEVAEQFRRESGAEFNMDVEGVKNRLAIRNAVQTGNVEEGISRANDLNLDILDSNPQLSFDLQQQHVIELIRDGKVSEALDYAQENLAPYCTEADDSFLKALEETIALLLFRDPFDSPLRDLMDMKKREHAAQEMDQAVLISQGHERDSKLHHLLKLLVLAQTELGEKASFPLCSFNHVA